jgi:8-oxo-dGTP pyrophosphatase MutT (NUDIX family)
MPHIHEKIDFTVEVFIVHENKVLLRKHDKYKMWLSIGGHVELDEDPNQAALREVKEEVGLDIELFGNTVAPGNGSPTYKELIPPKYLNRHSIKPGHEHVSLVYFGKSSSDQVIPEKETDEWSWFTLNDLNNKELDLQENVKFCAETALKELSSQ